MKDTLLIEIGTEELPPNALRKLVHKLNTNICDVLKKLNLPHGEVCEYVSPRRLAVQIKEIPLEQENQTIVRKGPSIQAALDDKGQPTKAALGFARSCGVEFAQLEQKENKDGTYFFFTQEKEGQPTHKLLIDYFDKFIENLPIPKKMRWADYTQEFVRPVHWLVGMLGKEVIPFSAFKLTASNQSHGHRFLHADIITLDHADNYETLMQEGKVIADFEKRKALIAEKIQQCCAEIGGIPKLDEDLLDEVTGLVEWPCPKIASFSEEFLIVPPEALITSMQHHQRCFAIFDKAGKLMPKFVLVSNIDSDDMSQVIHGNERVMHARLSDAKFFFEQDRKRELKDYVDDLKTMIFQKKLGTLYDKTVRVNKLSKAIAHAINEDDETSSKAAQIYKSDLFTNMVCEFPELQGIMGFYYAQNDGESLDVAMAIKESYLPRFAKDNTPSTNAGKILSMAERMDTLVGIFGIGQAPTGDKDPFGLRRSALAILRIIIENEYQVNLLELLTESKNAFGHIVDQETVIKVLDFCFDRFRAWFQEDGVNPKILDAVMANKRPTHPFDFAQKVKAVNHFQSLPQAESLAAANKRVRNILAKSGIKVDSSMAIEIKKESLVEPAEITLLEQINALKGKTDPMIKNGQYTEALEILASLKEPVDAFFDNVMVMVDDETLRDNRINLLNNLHGLFVKIADISKL